MVGFTPTSSPAVRIRVDERLRMRGEKIVLSATTENATMNLGTESVMRRNRPSFAIARTREIRNPLPELKRK